jgi:hypothetical protein
MGEVVIFVDENLQGLHTHVIHSQERLTQFARGQDALRQSRNRFSGAGTLARSSSFRAQYNQELPARTPHLRMPHRPRLFESALTASAAEMPHFENPRSSPRFAQYNLASFVCSKSTGIAHPSVAPVAPCMSASASQPIRCAIHSSYRHSPNGTGVDTGGFA